MKEIGNYQWPLWSKLIQKYLDVRKEFVNKTADCVDLHFKELLNNPISQVEEIYKSFDWKVSSKFRKRMSEYLEDSIHTKGDYKFTSFLALLVNAFRQIW